MTEPCSLLSLLAKLKELNGGAPQEHKLSEEILVNLEQLLLSVCGLNSSETPLTIQQINLLWKASHWPEGTTASHSQCVFSAYCLSSGH